MINFMERIIAEKKFSQLLLKDIETIIERDFQDSKRLLINLQKQELKNHIMIVIKDLDTNMITYGVGKDEEQYNIDNVYIILD